MLKQNPPSPAKEIAIKVHSGRGTNSNPVNPLGDDPTAPAAAPPRLEKNRRWTPWVVPVFAVANVVIFVITMYVNDCPSSSPSCFAPFLGRFAFQPRKENAMLGPSAATLEKMGALDVAKVVHGHQGWRLVTCSWLHAGVIHVLANMLSLLLIGVRLEQNFGFGKIGLLYVIAGLGGSLMSALFLAPDEISVGASGALFGLLGSMLSELLINWSMYAHKVAALLVLLFIAAINLAVGLAPHVDNFAHVGGLVSGVLLGFVFLIEPQFGHRVGLIKRKHAAYQYVCWVLAAALLVAWFTGGLVLLYRGVSLSDRCSWCRRL